MKLYYNIYYVLFIVFIPQLYLFGKIKNDTYSFNDPKEISTNIILKVLLVEFQDVKHRNPNYPSNLSLPAYTYDDFYNMLFSKNIYYSPNVYSPDSAEVFGSLRDYYRIMSNNHLDIKGMILNLDSNFDNIPDWIVLDKPKEYYDNGNVNEFRAESKSKAIMSGIDIATNDTTFLAIIYAGHTYRGYKKNSLNPYAFVKNHEYIMGERFASCEPYCTERDDPEENRISHFSHIGIHAHEFGHLLGFEDHIGGENNECWDLMSKGCYNGPNNEGSCPAPLNPHLRWIMGWIEYKSVNSDTTIIMEYDIQNPKVYKLGYGSTGNFFIVEFRRFNLISKQTNELEVDYNSFVNGLSKNSGILVWRKRPGNYVKLIYSSGKNCDSGDYHIFPGNNNIMVLSPWSDARNVKAGYYWVPNTKPSNNCGFEITKMENNYFKVDIYVEHPEKIAPSNPKNLKDFSISNVEILWDKNTEPDIDYYKIYKKNENEEYSCYDTSRNNEYIDFNETFDSLSNNYKYVYYKITAVDSSNKESTFSSEIKLPVIDTISCINQKSSNMIFEFSLYQNYPNPFNPTTTIEYSIQKQSNVTLKVFDAIGSEVSTLVNKLQPQGNYKITYNGQYLSSGVYFYKLQAGEFIEIKKMILMK